MTIPTEITSTASAIPRRRMALVGLCATEITSYGVLFYAFAVLAPSITTDTGWSATTVTAAFSLGLVISAVAGIPVGRWVDRHGPRSVMSAGSALSVAAVLCVAVAPSFPVFVCGWLLAGPAMAATFYAPAFVAITRWYGVDRVKALTALTLVAGFASTVFAPAAALLNSWLGWRGCYLVLAGVLAVATVPIHLFTLRLPWPAPDRGPDGAPTIGDGVGAVIRSRGFLALFAAIGLGGFAVYAVVVNQVPLLIERGLDPTTAAWALGLGGVGQVIGRLLYAPALTRIPVVARTVAMLAFGAGSTALLAFLAGPAPALVAAAMLAGMARGLFTLLQATAVSDRWGSAAYGRLTAILSAPATLAAAVAPWAGAAIATTLGGYPALFAALTIVYLAAALAAAWTRPAQTSVTANRPLREA